MKKILALLLAAMMALSLCACGGSAPAAEEPAAAPVAEAPVEEPAAGDDFAEYQDYVVEYTSAGAPTEEEAAQVAELVYACSTPEEIEAVEQLTVLYQNEVILTYADWIAAGKPAAETAGMGIDPNAGASGEPTGEPTEEPPAE